MRFCPWRAAAAGRCADYNRARTNVLGLKGVAEREDKQFQRGLETERAGREQVKFEREELGKPEYTGKVDGKEVDLIYRPGQGYFQRHNQRESH